MCRRMSLHLVLVGMSMPYLTTKDSAGPALASGSCPLPSACEVARQGTVDMKF